MKVNTANSFTKTMAVLKFADSLMPMTRIVVTSGDGDEGQQIEDCGRMGQGTCVDALLLEDRLHGQQRTPLSFVLHPDSAGNIANLWREVDAVVLKESDQGRAPTRSHGSGAKSVFQDKVPADDPGENLAQRGVAIGVGRTGNGYQRGEFGVTQAGEAAGDAGKNIREDDSGSGKLRRGGPGNNEDSGADDCADA